MSVFDFTHEKTLFSTKQIKRFAAHLLRFQLHLSLSLVFAISIFLFLAAQIDVILMAPKNKRPEVTKSTCREARKKYLHSSNPSKSIDHIYSLCIKNEIEIQKLELCDCEQFTSKATTTKNYISNK